VIWQQCCYGVEGGSLLHQLRGGSPIRSGGDTLLSVKNRLELEILLGRKKAIMLAKGTGVGWQIHVLGVYLQISSRTQKVYYLEIARLVARLSAW